MKDCNGDWHIKMETKNGKTRWLETERTNGDKSIVYETFYDAVNEVGLCLSEQIVGWTWGTFDTEEEVIECAKTSRLKAVYN